MLDKALCILSGNTGHFSITKPRRRSCQRLEDRLQIEGRALMTLSTSVVAVCRSSASVSSRVRSSFSFFSWTYDEGWAGLVAGFPAAGRLRTACSRFAIYMRSRQES